MAVPNFKYRQLAKLLSKGGAEYLGQDGQNHHVWSYVPAGEETAITAGIAAHKQGADVKTIYVKKLRQAWKLTKADGVSDEDFCDGRWR